MARIFKTLTAADATTTKTLLHEAIPLTGAIINSGTYANNNIKNYSHGMFQSVFDYPFLSSSANHIFDITLGYGAGSAFSASTNVQHSKKTNIYNQMAKMLVGHSSSGEIQKFDPDGDFSTTGDKMDSCYFINFSRLLTKDEIKKGSFTLELGLGNHTGAFNGGGDLGANTYTGKFTPRAKIIDFNAASDFRVNSPAGEYSFLYLTNSSGAPVAGAHDPTTHKVGLIYYQAGIVVLTSSIFAPTGSTFGATGGPFHGFLSRSIDLSDHSIFPSALSDSGSGRGSYVQFTGSAITASAAALRERIYNISFNNTTEIHSRIFFCRLSHNEFNYSTNPTYLSSSKIVVKNSATDTAVSYVTGIGLYNTSNELLAVAKLSEPLRKDESTELTLRVRLDY
tara:strand:+ start:110 stop:1294 length:1185 start_codon:yes stop_codon:yes gene_type:complete